MTDQRAEQLDVKVPSLNVREVRAEDLTWEFEANVARFYFDGGNETVDPFPAYAHDRTLVETEARKCWTRWRLQGDLNVHVAWFEDVHRTNGWSMYKYTKVGDGDEARWTVDGGSIWISGKRIPPHAAVTRYVVAHEYGHHVQWAIERERGWDLNSLIRDEYAELRGLEVIKHYGGGHWHRNPDEVFACDFRVLVAEAEVDFWPHDGVPHPHTVSAVQKWWDDARAAYQEARAAA